MEYDITNYATGAAAIGGFILVLLLFVFAIAIAIYVVEAIFLNKFNKLLYGKGTVLAWIPVANMFLLGKLTFNQLLGWILIGVWVATFVFSGSLASGLSTILSLGTIGLLIYAIIKYNKLKNGSLSIDVERAKSDSYSFSTPVNVSSVNNQGPVVTNTADTVANNTVNTQPSDANSVSVVQNKKFCTNCGREVGLEQSFCTNCGNKL